MSDLTESSHIFKNQSDTLVDLEEQATKLHKKAEIAEKVFTQNIGKY